MFNDLQLLETTWRGFFFLITIVYIVKEQIVDFHKPNQEVNNDTMKHKLSETYAEEFDLRD